MPGQRVFGYSEKIDSYVLILKGKIGIFYPETAAIKIASCYYNRIVCCSEVEAKRRIQNQNKPEKGKPP